VRSGWSGVAAARVPEGSRYAIASNGELTAGDYAVDGRAYLLAAETADLIVLNESIARMLVRWHAVVVATKS
jgi:hypothetical protein